MRQNRRQLMQCLAASSALAALPTSGWAQSTLSAGERRIDTLSDGHLVLPRSFALGDPPPEGIDEILARNGITGDQLKPDCNLTLLQDGPRKILFDVGAGPDFMPTAGKLTDAFAQLGVDPYDITDVVFTHAHPDHLWGLLDDFGDLAFPDAAYHMGRAEWDYWTDPNTVSTINENRQVFAVGAKSRLDMLADQINLFGDGQEILPGVAARLTAGHTPGHMAFEVQMGGESVMVLGDCIVNHHIAFARPELVAGSDQDPELGAKTRLSLLDQIATSKARIIGYHLPGGGMGRAERRGDGFVFVGENG